ncbi:MAG: hypothetical protein AAFY76_16100, partial [Cyanobacteria bacterium J06649_11]
MEIFFALIFISLIVLVLFPSNQSRKRNSSYHNSFSNNWNNYGLHSRSSHSSDYQSYSGQDGSSNYSDCGNFDGGSSFEGGGCGGDAGG